MAKRVSLQGKGVELFFGGSPRDAGPAPAPASDAVSPVRLGPSASTRTGAPARVHARTHTPIDEEGLFRGLGERQRLASSTFRFQPDELEQLDALADELNHLKPRRISKNDLVRLGLRWLLSDYQTHADRSLVGKLLDRV